MRDKSRLRSLLEFLLVVTQAMKCVNEQTHCIKGGRSQQEVFEVGMDNRGLYSRIGRGDWKSR